MKVLSLDIETTKMSHDVGGWGNAHLLPVACVATFDGVHKTLYTNEEVDVDATVKSLAQLKYDLDDHYEKGGILLGHNLRGFDLRVLKGAHLDIFIVTKFLEDPSRTIDTSTEMVKETGSAIHLDNLMKHTLNTRKEMSSADAPTQWQRGNFTAVSKYCLKDAVENYNLWLYGKEHGYVKAFGKDEGKVIQVGVTW